MVHAIYIIEAVAFVDFLGAGLFLPLLMIYARKIGANHIQVGLLRTTYSVFQLGSGPLFGSMSDLKGRKPVLMTSLLMSSICYILMGLTTSIYFILFLRAMIGLVKHTHILTKAMVADYVGNKQEQGAVYGRLMAVGSAGLTLGPLIGGYVEETYPENGFSYVAIAVGISFIFNAGLTSFLPCPLLRSRYKQHGNRAREGNILQKFFRSLQLSFIALFEIEWCRYGDIFIFKSLIGFAMGVYFSIYATLLKEQFQLTPKYIGGILSFQSTVGSISCCFICFINSFYVNDSDYSARTFHIFLLMTSAYLGLIFSSNAVFYTLWLVPLAIGSSVCRIITLEMVLNRSQGAHRGKLIGASNSVSALCGVVSPMVAGMIGEWLGVGYVIYASLLSSCLGILMSLYNKQYSSSSISIDDDRCY